MGRIKKSKSRIFAYIFVTVMTLVTDGQRSKPLMGAIQSCEDRNGRLQAVPFTNVTIADEFWAPRIATNRKVTIPYAFKKCEQTGRISNFAKAAGLMEGKFEGIYFNDSDLYKVIEAAAYSIKSYRDPELEKYVDGIIDKIAAAQWPDGYLYTFYSVPHRQPEKRWTDIPHKHELYCAGHFFEAAVAYYQATGKRKILEVAIKLADCIDSVFGPDKKRAVPGHEEIEIGLVKLYRVTDNQKYLNLAKFFLDERGRAHGRKLQGTYSQDHKPVVEQSEAVGHAVRAGYLYCGMADVAALTGDSDYIRALERVWQNVVGKKLYITGGIGARRGGESFGNDYELPNKTAYGETCAAIANAMWNHRMFLLHCDAKYIDVLERIIYNGFLSGISLSGDRFFYPNPLASDGKYQRSPWFGCACCPTNIVRFIPSLPGYAYAHKAGRIYVNLFIGGTATIKMDHNPVKLVQQTRYPWQPDVKITVEPQRSEEFAIYVRIPGWAQNRPVPSDLYRYLNKSPEKITLKVNGKPIAMDMEKGFARLRRKWKKGDFIELHLPMPIRRVLCHENVKDNVGKVALQRGPIVYCAEGLDNGGQVHNLVLPDDVPLKAEYRKDLLGGIGVIRGQAQSRYSSKDGKYTVTKEQDFMAIPYYAWAHRGAGPMVVWLTRSTNWQDAGVTPATWFVAPNGNDSWSGRLASPSSDRMDGPFATLTAARDAAREAGTKQPRKIIILPGQYFLTEPLTLNHKDSGLSIEAAQKARAYLFGGRKVTGWRKDGEKFYSVTLPGVKDRSWDFRCLVVNGRFCPRARLPEKGFFTHLNSFPVPWMTTTGGGWKRKPTKDELTKLKYRPEDLGPWLNINNAELTIYHMWDESLVGISAIDTESQTLTFINACEHPPGAFGVNKYVVWNVREGMTSPGQWYLDRPAEKLVYWPLPNEDMSTAEVFAPTIESIIRIQGTRDNPAKNITIRGLVLSVTTTPLQTGGFGAGRFAGALHAGSTENCRFEDLEIVNVGGQGIKVSGSNLHIERCHVHHTGACGIRFGGTGTVVSDNHIHDVGLTYPSAIGLQGGGQEAVITHNEIHDTPYTAINCGGENNRIENNLIYHAMQELHDGGGIYCFAGKNLVLRGNFIHDIIDTGGYGASAYYLDERSENCLVEDNLSLRVVRPSHNHMAKNNTIRNNVFISDEDARLTFPRSSDYVFEKNVIYAKGKIVFSNPEAITTFQNNILFSAEGEVQGNKLNRYSRKSTYQIKPAGGNLFVAPALVEFRKGKVRFAADSPTSKLGIKPIDVSNAGPRRCELRGE